METWKKTEILFFFEILPKSLWSEIFVRIEMLLYQVASTQLEAVFLVKYYHTPIASIVPEASFNIVQFATTSLVFL